MAFLRRGALAALLMCLPACGLSGGESGGGEHLPTSGAGPYGKLESDPETPAQEPFAIVEVSADLSDPSALAARSGGFDLWFTRRLPGASTSEIGFAHLPSLAELPDEGSAAAFVAAEAWELGAVEAPSVVDLGGDERVMYYQGGGDAAPAIGRARSTDGGRTWTRDGMVLAGGLDPAALLVGEHTYLYYGRPDGLGIGLAEAELDGAFVPSFDSIIVTSDTDPDAFDRSWVGEPNAVGGVSVAGSLRIGLFYVGRSSNGTHAIGHASSFDGRTFMPFFNGAAVLEASAPDDRGPSAVLFADHGVLFYGVERTARTVIGVATHD